MKLIPNWRQSLRMYSTQALIVIGGLQSILLALRPESPVPFFPETTWADVGYVLTVIVAALGALGRVIDQGHITESDVPQPTTQHTMMFADSLPCDSTEELHARNSQ